MASGQVTWAMSVWGLREGGLPGRGVLGGSVWFEACFQVDGTASARSWRRPQAWVERRRLRQEGRGREGVREDCWVPRGLAWLPAAALEWPGLGGPRAMLQDQLH